MYQHCLCYQRKWNWKNREILSEEEFRKLEVSFGAMQANMGERAWLLTIRSRVEYARLTLTIFVIKLCLESGLPSMGGGDNRLAIWFYYFVQTKSKLYKFPSLNNHKKRSAFENSKFGSQMAVERRVIFTSEMISLDHVH